MKLYDLSHLLNNDSPVYPGMLKPRFTPAAAISDTGYRETRLEFDSHQGTHIDAPAHMLAKGKTLDQMPVSSFTGHAFIVSVPDNMPFIHKEYLLEYRDKLKKIDFVLFKTGWSKYWGTQTILKDFQP